MNEIESLRQQLAQLNQARADALRDAADELFHQGEYIGIIKQIYRMAAEIEKG